MNTLHDEAIEVLLSQDRIVEAIKWVWKVKYFQQKFIRYAEASNFMPRCNKLRFVDQAWKTSPNLRDVKNRRLQKYAVFTYLTQVYGQKEMNGAFTEGNFDWLILINKYSGDKYERFAYDYRQLYKKAELEEITKDCDQFMPPLRNEWYFTRCFYSYYNLNINRESQLTISMKLLMSNRQINWNDMT